jgi:hypothetical protein
MHLLRNTYGRFSRIICFLFAVHLFNFSIDPKDVQDDFVPEDLTINDIESITEFIAETVFGWENAFEEHDEPDPDDGGSLDFCKIFFVNQGEAVAVSSTSETVRVKYFIWDPLAFAALPRSILAPPPKA